ncbi:MAG: complex I NDUFA9 subunit family protein [Deltaproteobacteria bacterium]|nr:complex I NDUFA9 subunit family protein [Deltaproteobacteria bacterium]
MVFMTGASGFVGSNLVRELLKEGDGVRCLLREPERPGHLAPASGVEIVKGDVTDRASILKALEGGDIDCVIHLVGILFEQGDQTFGKIHVEATENVVAACRECGVRRYIQMSALGTREKARSEYHRTKWGAEEIVMASGLTYTIFRPSVIFGEEDRFTNLFSGIMRRSPFVAIPGSGENRMQPLFIDDLVKAIVTTVKTVGHGQKVYDVGGLKEFTFNEIIDMIAKATGKRRVKVHLPMPLMRPCAALAEKLLSTPPITRDQLLMLEEDNVTGVNALTEVFGIIPTGFEEGMRRYLH